MIVKRFMAVLVIAIVWLSGLSLTWGSTTARKAGQPSLTPDLQKMSTGFFTENKGQWDPSVLFMGNTSFGTVIFTQKAIYYQQIKRDKTKNTTETQTIQLLFEDCQNPTIQAKNQTPHRTNYLIGNNPEKWGRECRNFTQIYYQNLWEGIDLAYFFTAEGMKYEYYVQATADPEDIKIQVRGADLINHGSQLEMRTQLGSIYDDHLKVFGQSSGYQMQSSFATDGNKISFVLPENNQKETIVIDPLLYSTFLGSGAYEDSYNMVVDSYGNAYVVGTLNSVEMPKTKTRDGSEIVPGYDQTVNSYDCFVIKLNPAGTELVYLTYLGGADSDFGQDIAVDSQGVAYVFGSTYGNDFPMTKTRSGSESVLGYDQTKNGVYGNTDLFLVKLNPQGSELLYSTYLGGTENEFPSCLVIDSQGIAYLGGVSLSVDIPKTKTNGGAEMVPGYNHTYSAGSFDCILINVNTNNNEILASTYLGGSDYDTLNKLTLDNQGFIYVVMTTYSANFPMTKTMAGLEPIPGYDQLYNDRSDGVLVKLNSSVSEMMYATFIGGSDTEFINDIKVDSLGQAFIVGMTEFYPPKVIPPDPSFRIHSIGVKPLPPPPTPLTNDFPMTTLHNGTELAPGYDKNFNGQYDGFAIKLNTTGDQFLYATFLGGTAKDSCESIALDIFGNAYISGYTAADLTSDDEGEDSIRLCAPINLMFNDFYMTRDHGGTEYPEGYDHVFNGLVDGFMLELNPNGTQLLYSTYLGGIEEDYARDVLVTSSGSAYVMGGTTSFDFPMETIHGEPEKAPGYDQVMDPYIPNDRNENQDVYVLKLQLTLSYQVDATVSGGHGTVTPGTQTVIGGQSATITITPDKGYQIGTITDNGSPKSTTKTYTIADVQEDHNVVVTFVPTPYVELALSIQTNKNEFLYGDDVLYKIDVINRGTAQATGVYLLVTFPPEIQYLSCDKYDGAVQPGGQVKFFLGILNAGSTKSFQLNGVISVRPIQEMSVRTLFDLNSNEVDTIHEEISFILHPKKAGEGDSGMRILVKFLNLKQDPQTGEYYINQPDELNLQLTLTGFSFPCTIKIFWGDGNLDTINESSDLQYLLTHKFTSKGTMTIRIQVTDHMGRSKEVVMNLTVR